MDPILPPSNMPVLPPCPPGVTPIDPPFPPVVEPEGTTLKTSITRAEMGEKLGVLLSGLFVLYLIVSGNYVGDLFNCGLQKLYANYAVKHFLGILTLYFFVTMVAPGMDWHPAIIAGITVVMYLVFVISNRSEPKMQLGFVATLAIIYILQIARDAKAKNVKRFLAIGNGAHAAAAAKEIDNLIRAQWGLAIVALVIVVFGHMIYIGKKRIEFNNRFNYLSLFGGSKCQFKDPRPISTYEAFLRFFGIRMNPASLEGPLVPVASPMASPPPPVRSPVVVYDKNDLPMPPVLRSSGIFEEDDDSFDEY